jgi:hypothetical protein
MGADAHPKGSAGSAPWLAPCCCGRLLRPACAWPPTRRCAAAWGGCAVAGAALIVAVFAIGLAAEAGSVARAPSTALFYSTPLVCTRTNSSAPAVPTFATVANRSVAAQLSLLPLAHCGPCGACSTEQDLAAYVRTRLTLTATTTQCALKVLAGGRDAVAACMDASVGLSAACTRCWVDNVVCDQHACLFTCLWGVLRGERNNRDAAQGQLSPCLACDEALCGPAFVTCAGANRRRSGVTSDIGRGQSELCNLTAASA